MPRIWWIYPCKNICRILLCVKELTFRNSEYKYSFASPSLFGQSTELFPPGHSAWGPLENPTAPGTQHKHLGTLQLKYLGHQCAPQSLVRRPIGWPAQFFSSSQPLPWTLPHFASCSGQGSPRSWSPCSPRQPGQRKTMRVVWLVWITSSTRAREISSRKTGTWGLQIIEWL